MTRRAVCLALLMAPALWAQGLELPLLPDSISAAITKRRPGLAASLAPLKRERAGMLRKGEKFDAACGRVVAGSAKDVQCGEDLRILRDAVDEHHGKSVAFLADLGMELRAQAVIDGGNALARRLGWDDDELKRVDKALNGLREDGNFKVTGAQVSAVWRGLRARGQGGEWARDAANGQGPALGSARAGTQSFHDCTIFALANASGEPYGVVAARANGLIAAATWRSTADRASPQRAIELQGLLGGEVVMLAEAFGEAEVVNSAMFAATIKAGRAVMVSVFLEGVVFPSDGSSVEGHQVTLTRTFQRGAETWYEMIDSNQAPDRRLYVSAAELTTILQQNGVAFRPNAKNIPRIPK